MSNSKVMNFLVKKPAIWIPFAAMIAIGGGITASKYSEGNDTVADKSPDPVFIPPVRVNAPDLEISAEQKKFVSLDSELLEQARQYRLEKITAMRKELKGEGDVHTSPLAPQGSPLLSKPQPPSYTMPTQATQVTQFDDAESLTVLMTSPGPQGQVVLQRGGKTLTGGVGDSLFGMKISTIYLDRVCFVNKSCVKVMR